jgi:hypothetical protein
LNEDINLKKSAEESKVTETKRIESQQMQPTPTPDPINQDIKIPYEAESSTNKKDRPGTSLSSKMSNQPKKINYSVSHSKSSSKTI